MDTSAPANPSGAFFGASRTAQALSATVRAIGTLSPGWGTRAALRLFFTPMPWKLARRPVVPPGWTFASWPFEGASLTAYRRRDVPPGRPVVLLVHGWAGSGLQMRPLAEVVAEAGFDPVLVDFPAHGRSRGWRSTLPQFTRALHAAHGRLGPLHGIVAHSLGALAAMHSAARGLAVQRLVLLAPAAPPSDFLRAFVGRLGLPEAVAEGMRAHIELSEGVPLAQFEPEWLGPRVAQPTLVVHDEGDRVAPLSASRRTVGMLHEARLQPTRGLGHNRVLSAPDVAMLVLRHLAGPVAPVG